MSANVFEVAAKLTLDSSSYDKGLHSAKSLATTIGSGISTALKVGVAAVAAGTTAVVAFGKSSVDAGMEFDKSMSQVAATMGKTMTDMQNEVGTTTVTLNGQVQEFSGNLREFAQFMGQNTAFSATQAADALNYMALAGYDTQTSMAMLPNVLNLAAAGNMDLARASDMVTDTQTAFGISLDRTSQMVDEMAKAASTGNTSVEQLGDAFLVVGGLTQELNGGMVKLADGTQKPVDGVQELEIALTAMANAGVKGSEAGTHMRNMLLKLSSPTDKGTKQLEALGVTVFDAQDKMRSLSDIFGDLSGKLNNMTQKEKISAISDLFNTRDIASAEALLNAVGQDWDSIGESILDAQGAAQKMADTQLDNLAGDITLFKSALEGVKITISDQLTPVLRGFVQFGTNALTTLNDAFKEGGLSGAMEALGTILSDGLNKVIAELPNMIDAGMRLIGALGQGILDNLPMIIDAAIKIVNQLVNGIVIALPALADGALKIVIGLAEGITKMLPTLMPTIVELLLEIVEIITDNLDLMTDAAVALIMGLSEGLINAVPILVEKAPEIIAKFAIALLKAAPQLLTVGFRAVGHLWAGIAKGIAGADVFDSLKNKAGGAASWISQRWSDLTKDMSGGWKRSTDDMLNVGSHAFGSGGRLEAAFNEFTRMAGGVNGNLLSSFKDMYVEWGGGLIGTFAAVFSTIEDLCMGAIMAIGQLFGVDLYEPINDFFFKVNDVVYQGILEKVDEITGAIKEGVSRFWDEIILSYHEGGSGLAGIAEVIFDQIANVFRNALDIIGDMIGVDMSLVKETVINNWFVIRNSVVEAVTNLQEGIIAIWNAIVESMKPLLDAFKNLFDVVFQAIGVLINNALAAISNAITTTWNNIVAFVTPILQTLLNTFTQMWTAITTAISNALNVADQTIMTIWNTISQWLASKINEIKQAVTNGFNQLAEMLKGPLDKIREHFVSAFEKIKEIISGLISEASQWGRDLMESFAEGIRDKISYVTGLINDLANKVRDLIHFSEPDKGPLSDFHTYAPDMMKLFAKGIKDNTKLVTDQVAQSFDFGNLIKTQGYDITSGVNSFGAAGEGGVYGGFVQNNYITSPQELDPSETARQVRNATRDMVLQLRMA